MKQQQAVSMLSKAQHTVCLTGLSNDYFVHSYLQNLI